MESEFKTHDATIPSRLTAHKVWLADINSKEFQQKEGIPDYVEVQGRPVSRVNIVASVIDKYESEKYASLTLDDSSGQIRLKAFADAIPLLKSIETGDIIITIARLRNFNNENYLYPEILRKVDPKYAHLRKLELTIEHGQRDAIKPKPAKPIQQTLYQEQQEQFQETQQGQTETQETSTVSTFKDKVKIHLEKLDEGEGVEVTSLQAALEEDQEKIRSILDDLVGEGEAYEPRPGRFKLI